MKDYVSSSAHPTMSESLYCMFLCCLVLAKQQFYLETNTFFVCAYIVVSECLHYSMHDLNNADGRRFGGRGRSSMHWRFVTSWCLSSCWIYFVHFFHFMSSSTISPQKEKGRSIYRDRANQTLLEQWCTPFVFWISAFPFHLAPHRRRMQRGLKEKSRVIL